MFARGGEGKKKERGKSKVNKADRSTFLSLLKLPALRRQSTTHMILVAFSTSYAAVSRHHSQFQFLFFSHSNVQLT